MSICGFLKYVIGTFYPNAYIFKGVFVFSMLFLKWLDEEDREILSITICFHLLFGGKKALHRGCQLFPCI